MDYRNAVKWYQWDPTKWFIAVCSYLGAASHLRVFPDVEVTRSQLTMKLKQLKTELDSLPWPVASDDLPIISWESCKSIVIIMRSEAQCPYVDQEQSKERSLVLVSGFIHDVNDFVDQHPGGQGILQAYIGRDATPAFFGGVYDHSNAAHNVSHHVRLRLQT